MEGKEKKREKVEYENWGKLGSEIWRNYSD